MFQCLPRVKGIFSSTWRCFVSSSSTPFQPFVSLTASSVQCVCTASTCRMSSINNPFLLVMRNLSSNNDNDHTHPTSPNQGQSNSVEEEVLDRLREICGDFSEGENNPNHRGLVQSYVEKTHTTTEYHQALALFDTHIRNSNLDEAERILFNNTTDGVLRTTMNFNQLLEQCALKGEWLRCETVYNNMLQFKVSPNSITYASLLVGLRNISDEDTIHLILKMADDMGFSHVSLVRNVATSSSSEFLYLLKQQLARVGLESFVSPPSSHVVDDAEYEKQWDIEAHLGVTTNAIPTKSTKQLFDEVMTSEVDEENMSLFHVWKDDVVKELENRKEELVAFQSKLATKRRGRKQKAWDSLTDKVEVLVKDLLYNSTLSAVDIAHVVLAEMEPHLLSAEHGCKTAQVVRVVGNAIYSLYFTHTHAADGPPTTQREIYFRYLKEMQENPTQSPSTLWKNIEKDYLDVMGVDDKYYYKKALTSWTPEMLFAIGGELVDVVMTASKLHRITGNPEDAKEQVFYKVIEFDGPRRLGFVRAHKMVHSHGHFSKENKKFGVLEFRRSLMATDLPMLVPPIPWTGTRSGANLLAPVTFMRTIDGNYHHYGLVSQTAPLLTKMFDALSYISSTSWRVNSQVADIVERIFFEEVGVPALSIPPHRISDLPTLKSTANEAERVAHIAAIQQLEKDRNEAFSMRITLHLRLMVAQMFKDKPFYLPHNIDFRGRAYTIAPYLTHIGDDMCRGLLTFAKKKPLGDRGLRWLKIHLSNVYGNDKCSLDDREKFAEQNIHHINETVSNPLKFLEDGETMWWLEGDSPWQILSTCLELHAALNSPDPTAFESSLPVHQDGTCNGLQHYAALGRDKDGARHVNLSTSPGEDFPQDVYSAVARKMDILINKNANGEFAHPVSQTHERAQEIAKMIASHGPLQRKIVKQTVMTNVYGVTFVGGRDQIVRQLRAAKLVPNEDIRDTANYLTTLVFQSLGEIFEKAQKIQKWLSRQAKMIAASGEPVAWITPLGFPVVQPYHKANSITFPSKLQAIYIVETSNPGYLPAIGKQASAFPPNFVHSLDSTHMMLTANRCREKDIVFASVHDSFWTHACSVDEMSEFIREEFVSMHSKPILQNLVNFFKLSYEGRPLVQAAKGGIVEVEDDPGQGEFEIKEVMNSRYFFS
eukprot:m.135922 g.135922  ORF g.135922 m.135922 type:complete len:1162 (-) comp10314_c0_seq1:1679-5164(-)